MQYSTIIGIEESSIVQSEDRLLVLQRIAHNERYGLFDLDVENDAPTIPIDIKSLDLLNKKFSSKIYTKVANFMGRRFFEGMMSQKKVIFKGVVGLENIKDFDGGAMITCNHCHMFDNYAAYLALKQHFVQRKFVLHKVIREGNFSYPGIIGFFMRHCNTLPVQQSSQKPNIKLTAKSGQAIVELLKRGKQVLIYPEQAMWWCYRKPRPLKKGAFHFAAKVGVPIIPLFITMQDSDSVGEDGFFVQEFTVHILPIIRPNPESSVEQNLNDMHMQNFELWKQTYESEYKIPLEYTKEHPQ